MNTDKLNTTHTDKSPYINEDARVFVRQQPRTTFTRKQQLERLIEKNPLVKKMIEVLKMNVEL